VTLTTPISKLSHSETKSKSKCIDYKSKYQEVENEIPNKLRN